MGKVVAGMTMSLDGFVNDRSGRVDRLFPDLEALRQTDLLQESIRDTGAVVMGRHAYEMAGGDMTGYEYQVPIFVLTHDPPAEIASGGLEITFVSEGIENAVAQAKDAAGARDVLVLGGASTVKQCLRAGLADELHIGLIPVLLGGGLMLFEGDIADAADLELMWTKQSPGRTDLGFRVVK